MSDMSRFDYWPERPIEEAPIDLVHFFWIGPPLEDFVRRNQVVWY